MPRNKKEKPSLKVLFEELRQNHREITFEPALRHRYGCSEGGPWMNLDTGYLFLHPVHLSGESVHEFASRDRCPCINLRQAGLHLNLSFDPHDRRSPYEQFKASAQKAVKKHLRGRRFFIDPSRPLENEDFLDLYNGNKTRNEARIVISTQGRRVRGFHTELQMSGTWWSFIPEKSPSRKIFSKEIERFSAAFEEHIKSFKS